MIKLCVYCQDEFDGRPDQHFCTNRCKVRNHRAHAAQSESKAHVSATPVSSDFYNQPFKTETELGMAVEMRRLELEYEEKMIKLKIQESEKLRIAESEQRERKHQHELEIGEISALDEIRRVREELQATKAQNEELRKKEVAQQDYLRSRLRSEPPEQEAEQENSEGIDLLQLVLLGLASLWLSNVLKEKPKPPGEAGKTSPPRPSGL